MRLMIYLVASSVLFGAAGCGVLHSAKQTTSTTVIVDSANVNVTERMVEVVVPADTVWLEHYIECEDAQRALTKPKKFKAQVKGIRSSGAIEVDSEGKLLAIFNCNQWRDSVKVRDTEIQRLRSVAKTDSTVITVPVRYIPKAYKASMWFSWIVIALLLLWIGVKAAKIYFKLKVPLI